MRKTIAMILVWLVISTSLSTISIGLHEGIPHPDNELIPVQKLEEKEFNKNDPKTWNKDNIGQVPIEELVKNPKQAKEFWGEIDDTKKDTLFKTDFEKFKEKAHEFFKHPDRLGIEIDGFETSTGMRWDGKTLRNKDGFIDKDKVKGATEVEILKDGGFRIAYGKNEIEATQGAVDAQGVIYGSDGKVVEGAQLELPEAGGTLNLRFERDSEGKSTAIIEGKTTITIQQEDGKKAIVEVEGKFTYENQQQFEGERAKVTITGKNEKGEPIIEKVVEGKFKRRGDMWGIEDYTLVNEDGTQKSITSYFEDNIAKVNVHSVGHPLLILGKDKQIPAQIDTYKGVISYDEKSFVGVGTYHLNFKGSDYISKSVPERGAEQLKNEFLFVYNQFIKVNENDPAALESLKNAQLYAHIKTPFSFHANGRDVGFGEVTINNDDMRYVGKTDSTLFTRYLEGNTEVVTIDGVDTGELADIFRKVDIARFSNDKVETKTEEIHLRAIKKPDNTIAVEQSLPSRLYLAGILQQQHGVVLIKNNFLITSGKENLAYYGDDRVMNSIYQKAGQGTVRILSPRDVIVTHGENVRDYAEAAVLLLAGKKEESQQKMQELMEQHPEQRQGRLARLTVAQTKLQELNKMAQMISEQEKNGKISKENAEQLRMELKFNLDDARQLYLGGTPTNRLADFDTTLAFDDGYLSDAYIGLAQADTMALALTTADNTLIVGETNTDRLIKNIKENYEKAIASGERIDANLGTQRRMAYATFLSNVGDKDGAIEQLIIAHQENPESISVSELSTLRNSIHGEKGIKDLQRMLAFKLLVEEGKLQPKTVAGYSDRNQQVSLAEASSAFYQSFNPINVKEDLEARLQRDVELYSKFTGLRSERQLVEEQQLLVSLVAREMERSGASFSDALRKVASTPYAYTKTIVDLDGNVKLDVVAIVPYEGKYIGVDVEDSASLPKAEQLPSASLSIDMTKKPILPKTDLSQYQLISSRAAEALLQNPLTLNIIEEEIHLSRNMQGLGNVDGKETTDFKQRFDQIKLDRALEFRRAGMYEDALAILKTLPDDVSTYDYSTSLTTGASVKTVADIRNDLLGKGVLDLSDASKDALLEGLKEVPNALNFVVYGGAAKLGALGLKAAGMEGLQAMVSGTLGKAGTIFGNRQVLRFAGMGLKEAGEEAFESGVGIAVSSINPTAGQVAEIIAMGMTGGPDALDRAQMAAMKSISNRLGISADDVTNALKHVDVSNTRSVTEALNRISGVNIAQSEVSSLMAQSVVDSAFEGYDQKTLQEWGLQKNADGTIQSNDGKAITSSDELRIHLVSLEERRIAEMKLEDAKQSMERGQQLTQQIQDSAPPQSPYIADRKKIFDDGKPTVLWANVKGNDFPVTVISTKEMKEGMNKILELARKYGGEKDSEIFGRVIAKENSLVRETASGFVETSSMYTLEGVILPSEGRILTTRVDLGEGIAYNEFTQIVGGDAQLITQLIEFHPNLRNQESVKTAVSNALGKSDWEMPELHSLTESQKQRLASDISKLFITQISPQSLRDMALEIGDTKLLSKVTNDRLDLLGVEEFQRLAQHVKTTPWEVFGTPERTIQTPAFDVKAKQEMFKAVKQDESNAHLLKRGDVATINGRVVRVQENIYLPGTQPSAIEKIFGAKPTEPQRIITYQDLGTPDNVDLDEFYVIQGVSIPKPSQVMAVPPQQRLTLHQMYNLAGFTPSIHNHPTTWPNPSVNDVLHSYETDIPEVIVSRDKGAYTYIRSKENAAPLRDFDSALKKDPDFTKAFMKFLYRYKFSETPGKPSADWNNANMERQFSTLSSQQMSLTAKDMFGRMPADNFENINQITEMIHQGVPFEEIDRVAIAQAPQQLPGRALLPSNNN